MDKQLLKKSKNFIKKYFNDDIAYGDSEVKLLASFVKRNAKAIPLVAEVKVQIAETERLLREALSCQNNDKEERGLCCQCREAINNYFNNKKKQFVSVTTLCLSCCQAQQ